MVGPRKRAYTRREAKGTGIRIKTIREKLGLSREQLAVVLSTNPATVWRWEMGEFEPEGTAAALLAVLEQRVAGMKSQESLAEVVGQVAVGAAVGAALLAILGVLFGGKK